jgi:hypothetical protein
MMHASFAATQRHIAVGAEAMRSTVETFTSIPGAVSMLDMAPGAYGIWLGEAEQVPVMFSVDDDSSKKEQLARFAARLDDPRRNWKISESDYVERAYWDDYIIAYEDAINATSTERAPWFVIPSNHKWFRNLAVSQIVADAMEHLHMSYPKPAVDLASIRRKYHDAKDDEKK